MAFFATVVRYGIWSYDERVVDTYLQGCRAASAMVRFGNRQLRTLDNETLVANLGKDGVSRMVVERLTHRPGIMLTSQEVVTLAHIPNARTFEMFACIEQRKGLEWTGPQREGADQDGATTLGTNEFAGGVRDVDILLPGRLRHMVLSGVTGVGKSTELETLILADAEAGLGMCVIDPHGDLAVEVLSRLPRVAYAGSRGRHVHGGRARAALEPARLGRTVGQGCGRRSTGFRRHDAQLWTADGARHPVPRVYGPSPGRDARGFGGAGRADTPRRRAAQTRSACDREQTDSAVPGGGAAELQGFGADSVKQALTVASRRRPGVDVPAAGERPGAESMDGQGQGRHRQPILGADPDWSRSLPGRAPRVADVPCGAVPRGHAAG